MGIAPQEIPYEPAIPPQEPEEKIEEGKKENPLLMPKGFFRGYFPESPELEEQDFYLVPMKDIEAEEFGEKYKTKEVIRDAIGQIVGLPKLDKGDRWIKFTGRDGNEYVTKANEFTDKALESYEEIAPIE
ncbi:MAG: hypothetical protein AAB655_00450 [Patescibacteria group bacterium]